MPRLNHSNATAAKTSEHTTLKQIVLFSYVHLQTLAPTR